MATLVNERITTRVSSETKELLEKALSLSGYASLNSFIANAAITEAKRLIEQDMRIRLCQEDALAFVHALENEEPINNERFLRAARRHKETISADRKSK
ncbi:ABC transporter [Xenorhabdus beddingii]|uniref:ABC transporter n=1 Tax=Xenorhabdus beddingii TaxID=40578 RepID=A0A1Y2SU75_9GAMM|nr:DUF1778 domain-containing protein [Xenorhabdus beddingii]OTA21922.1 ABC transporter [Xenorhabdus beddingii]